MHYSYDRLIDLAKRTGDRLIVHDPVEGRDVVIMDIDEYEKIVDEREYDGYFHENKYDSDFDGCCYDDFERRDVRGMSEGELLDQINRDIAKWRADKDMEDKWEREDLLEDEAEDVGPFDPFAEQDYHPAEWHSAGDIMGDRYKIPSSFVENEDEEEIAFSGSSDSEKDSFFTEASEEEWEIPKEFLVSNDKPDEIKIDNI